MLANLQSSLLLSTSNRSEAAVGYATMDGDTSGGLAPIAGIDKAYLRQWLVWLEKIGPAGLGPIPALAAVNCQAPTAELRPASERQTDEADLMPYELLDAIERAAIRDKLTPLEVFQNMQPHSRNTRRTNWANGSNASFACGVATSGSASDTRRRSIWMMRILTPRRGAASRSSRAATSASSWNCGRTSTRSADAPGTLPSWESVRRRRYGATTNYTNCTNR